MNELLKKAETLQNLLVSRATGGAEDDEEYRKLREIFVSERSIESLLPRFVHTCRSLDQFWGFIKPQFQSYAERRTFLWGEFRPLITTLEKKGGNPSDEAVSDALKEFDEAHVHAVWSKALDRRETDPEGAITSARTLLETVCKYVLDDLKITYDDTSDLPKLYTLTSKALNLSPDRHSEQVIKQILSGCVSVVSGLGSLRNKLSDSHGKGRTGAKPESRHAQLAVNIAGSVSTFLTATWKARKELLN